VKYPPAGSGWEEAEAEDGRDALALALLAAGESIDKGDGVLLNWWLTDALLEALKHHGYVLVGPPTPSLEYVVRVGGRGQGKTGELVRRVVEAVRKAMPESVRVQGDLDAAWAAAEAALPEGWRLFSVSRPGDAERYWATAHGPILKGRCSMGREHEDYLRENGYGPTPADALLALAARLSEVERHG